MKNILEFQKYKQQKQKISMVTCYDFWTAQILNSSQVDCLLVGDSASMIMHGAPTPIEATVKMMTTHIFSVARGAPDKFIIGDMPFLSFRKSLDASFDAAEMLMRAGAHAVKIEGLDGNEDFIRKLVLAGVPVMGHLGLTPQSHHALGGFRVQGKDDHSSEKIFQDAKKLQDLGCFAIVLECIPQSLAERVSIELEIPTVGIGAGDKTDGQVLVLQDLLGANPHFQPKFLRKFGNIHNLILEAVNTYDQEVKTQTFPSKEESYE